jgi:hypothetical protein
VDSATAASQNNAGTKHRITQQISSKMILFNNFLMLKDGIYKFLV